MNKINKIVSVGILVLLLFSLTACGGAKTSLSGDEFRAHMEESGYEVINGQDQADGQYEAMLFASDQNDNYNIEYYAHASESDAVSMYNTIQNAFEAEKGNASSNKSVSLANYSKYTQTSNGQYYAISRIDNTLLFAVVDTEYKDAVNDAMKAMGY